MVKADKKEREVEVIVIHIHQTEWVKMAAKESCSLKTFEDEIRELLCFRSSGGAPLLMQLISKSSFIVLKLKFVVQNIILNIS